MQASLFASSCRFDTLCDAIWGGIQYRYKYGSAGPSGPRGPVGASGPTGPTGPGFAFSGSVFTTVNQVPVTTTDSAQSFPAIAQCPSTSNSAATLYVGGDCALTCINEADVTSFTLVNTQLIIYRGTGSLAGPLGSTSCTYYYSASPAISDDCSVDATAYCVVP
jgi:hypothetical protein